MKNQFILFAGLLLVAGVANAQTTQSSVGTTSANVQTPITDPSAVSLIGGLKSFNDFGRKVEVTNPANGRMLKSKNEFFLGGKNGAGWGAYFMAVENGYMINSDPKNHGRDSRIVPGDPSFSILHPVFDNGRVKISGQFKQYFPVSDFSQSRHLWEQTYYSVLTWKMPHRFDFANILIPRYFSQQYYKDDGKSAPDTTFYTEDYTTVTYPVSKSVRVGIGQHYQVEFHQKSPAGQSLEVYPMADVLLGPTIFIGPRIYFPVAVQNSVFEAPTAVNLDQVQPEIYFQATL